MIPTLGNGNANYRKHVSIIPGNIKIVPNTRMFCSQAHIPGNVFGHVDFV